MSRPRDRRLGYAENDDEAETNMIITAALPWWNERPEDLEDCIRAVSKVATRVVALDGAYARYPDATIASPQEQAETIKRVAAECGIECEIVVPDRLWAGQVEKRCALLNLAAVNTDWILTIDADHIIVAKRGQIWRELERTQADVLSVPYFTPLNKSPEQGPFYPGQWHINQVNISPWLPHIWRPLPSLRVERFHWWYSALVGGKRMWLWAPYTDDTYPHLKAVEVTSKYRVDHRCLFRTPEQMLASRAFLNDREMIVAATGQEDDVPGLPPPHYDYDSLPA